MLPGILHFIWAGGDRLMPDHNINNICLWAKANPTFKIYFWIDKQSYGKTNTPLIEAYQAQFGRIAARNNVELINQQIQFKDIEEEKVCSFWIRYELGRLRPNYGASSDMLRYRILLKFGGCYFDSDIKPGTESLENYLLAFFPIVGKNDDDDDNQESQNLLFIDPNSQDENAIGNDILFCSPGNLCMRTISELAEKNYSVFENTSIQHPVLGTQIQLDYFTYNARENLAYSYDLQFYIQDTTPRKTGPGPVRAVVEPVRSNKNYISLIPSSLRTHVREHGNAWFGTPLKKCTQDLAIAAVIKTIEIEATHMGIIRMDDHIENLKTINLPLSEVIDVLKNNLTNLAITPDNILVAQNCCRYTATVELYKLLKIRSESYHYYLLDQNLLGGERLYYKMYYAISGTSALGDKVGQSNSQFSLRELTQFATALNGFLSIIKDILAQNIHEQTTPNQRINLLRIFEGIKYILNIYDESGLKSALKASLTYIGFFNELVDVEKLFTTTLAEIENSTKNRSATSLAEERAYDSTNSLSPSISKK